MCCLGMDKLAPAKLLVLGVILKIWEAVFHGIKVMPVRIVMLQNWKTGMQRIYKRKTENE